MSRPLRYQPEEWSTFFVTARCIHSRFLLRPSPRVNKLIIGVLARAVERFDIRDRCHTDIFRNKLNRSPSDSSLKILGASLCHVHCVTNLKSGPPSL